MLSGIIGKFFAVTTLIGIVLRQGMAFSAGDMVRLRAAILGNYSVGIMPLKNQSVSIPVKMSFFLIMIHNLNMKNQVLTASGWLKFEWCDEFLQWDPHEYGGIDELILFQKEVWLPDIFVENTAQHYREIGNNQMLISVKHTGMIHWEPGIITETSCPVNIGKYPFDKQSCNIQFLTWMHTNKTLTVAPETSTINLDALLPNGEWDITSTEAKSYRYPSTYRPGTDHTGVTFIVHLRRKRFFYVLNTIIPVVMLSCLNVLVFILPSDCGERMALAVTVLLAFTVYLGIISDNIPKTSESLSLLAIYLTSLLALSTASVVCAGIVLNIHYRDPSLPVPKFLKWVFSSVRRRQTTSTSSSSSMINRHHKGSTVSFDGSRESSYPWERRHGTGWDQRRPSIWARRQTIRDSRASHDAFYDDHYAIQEDSGSDDDKVFRDSVNKTYSSCNDKGHQSISLVSDTSDTLANDHDQLCQKAQQETHEQQQQQQQQQQTHGARDSFKSAFTFGRNSKRHGNSSRSVSYDKVANHEPISNAQKFTHRRSSSDEYEMDSKFYRKPYEKCTRCGDGERNNVRDESRKHSMGYLPPEIHQLLKDRANNEHKNVPEITWHDIGNALDRWLFWVFFICTNTVTVLILVLFVHEDV